MSQRLAIVRSLSSVCILAFSIGACSEQAAKQPPKRATPSKIAQQEKAAVRDLAEHDYYLCCNMGFDSHREANDANYLYPGSGNFLPVGTRVRVTRAAGSRIGRAELSIQPEGQEQTYKITFKFGLKRMAGSEYLHGILRDTDPRQVIAGKPRDVADAITEGRLIPGLTKEEALLARGYPPLHRTAGIEADEWMYYNSREAVDVVRFQDGRITSVERGQPH